MMLDNQKENNQDKSSLTHHSANDVRKVKAIQGTMWEGEAKILLVPETINI